MSQGTMPRPAVAALSGELMLLVGRLNRAVTRAARLDVPTASLRLLSQVDELGPVTIGALATSDHCSQPTMSAGITALVERGWAVKTPNPDDARSILVDTTEAGRAVLRETRQRRAAVVTELFSGDPDHDEQDLATAVAVLRGLLSPTTTSTLHHPEGTA